MCRTSVSRKKQHRTGINLHIDLLFFCMIFFFSPAKGNYQCTIARYGYANWTNNVHIHIYIEHRNLETRKTLDDYFVQVGNFLLPLSLKVLQHKEREAPSFYSGFFIHPPPTRVAPATKVSASERKSTVFPRVRFHLNSLTFSKSPKVLRALPVRDVIRTVLPRFPCRLIVTSLSDTSAMHARLNTYVNVVPK